jgi:hypothetical protein
LDENHRALLPRLFALLRPGGQLVVQVPSNYDHPTLALIVEIASEEPFAQALHGWNRIVPVLSIEEYAELLYTLGGEDITVCQIPQRSSAGLVAVLHFNSSASRRVLMLQLHRTLHCSTSVSLGHLTIGPFWPSMPSQKRCLTVNILPGSGLPAGTPNVQLKSSPMPAVSLLDLWHPGRASQQCPQHVDSILYPGTKVQAFRAAIPSPDFSPGIPCSPLLKRSIRTC